MAVQTGSLKATVVTPTLHQPRGRVTRPPCTPTVAMVTHNGVGDSTDEDVVIMMMMIMVVVAALLVIVCPWGSCFHIRPTILRS